MSQILIIQRSHIYSYDNIRETVGNEEIIYKARARHVSVPTFSSGRGLGFRNEKGFKTGGESNLNNKHRPKNCISALFFKKHHFRKNCITQLSGLKGQDLLSETSMERQRELN